MATKTSLFFVGIEDFWMFALLITKIIASNHRREHGREDENGEKFEIDNAGRISNGSKNDARAATSIHGDGEIHAGWSSDI